MNKIMLMGDLHLTDARPVRRTDNNYLRTMLDKLFWVNELYYKEGCVALLQAGDFFNSHRVSCETISVAMEVVDQVKIFLVYGQHDMYYHSTNHRNTPLHVLNTAEFVTILDNTGIMIADELIYGASWGEQLPKNKNGIGVVHRMVIDNDKLWLEQKDYIYAVSLLNNHNFDLILTGDNHKKFVVESKGKLLVNPGSFMRTNINQYDHEPAVYIYDVELQTLVEHKIPIQPPEEIFSLKNYEEEVDRSEKLQAFVEGLSSDKEINGLNFVKNLKSMLDNEKIVQAVKTIVEEILCQVS